MLAGESFENEEIAKIMNENYVNILVDREERPDIDRIYMGFLQVGSNGSCYFLEKLVDSRKHKEEEAGRFRFVSRPSGYHPSHPFLACLAMLTSSPYPQSRPFFRRNVLSQRSLHVFDGARA